jgi:hypothetical protein
VEGEAYAVKGNVTLYAKWNIEIKYTVTYFANGASGTAPAAQRVDPGTVITLPGMESMVYVGRTFEGWNTQSNGSGTSYVEGEAYTVNADISFYARWLSVPITPPGATLVEQLAYIRNDSSDGAVFDIVVYNDVYIGPTTVSTMGRNIIVNISSANSEDVKSIQLESVGHLFSVDTNITLRLKDIVLKGMSTNNSALVLVGQGGTLILNSGSKITLNTNSSGNGGGVYVNGGTLELNEGTEIIRNKATGTYYVSAYGGGVLVENRGNIVIREGLISENTASGGSNDGCGGGIAIMSNSNSTVTMSGGIISKNTCSSYGGGIYVGYGTSFIKRAAPGNSTSGIIYGGTGENANTATGNRGNAIHLYQAFSFAKYRNSTLGYYDEISSASDEGWE